MADHDLDRRVSAPFGVSVSGNLVSGTIWFPDDAVIAAVAIVHGDGAQDRLSAGGYAPLINALLDRGIAVASWDKPGVGASGGNWLLQSMSDRADETRAVLHLLKERFQGTAIGALGFSQAGWVLPSLTRADADFLILAGAAMSWQQQGAYFTRMRLRQAGLDAPTIAATLAAQAIADDRAFGPNATADDAPAGMTPDRWRFIRQNRGAESRQALMALDVPLLAIWGAEDLNVDPVRNAARFRQALAGRDAPTRIIVLPDATHGLLKAPAYNWQLSEDWSHYAVARFLLEGRHAYAPGALDAISDWIEGGYEGD
ncbi:alpha/beta hydrolase [Actibacterium ureilyticum]|uniref:alpha/beta hydrolase n=1 Tax=Actibacterium ureilyticum TaxID=1590614 RepID=UPI001FECE15A|nr:alpha/beta hydrolase [Actibacterium ureilyticum]